LIFASPWWLLGLLALPLAAGLEVWLVRRDREGLARLVARPLWGRVVRRPAERWRWIRLALLLLGTAGLVGALARPQWGIVREKIEREGVDVVLLLDTSASMGTADVAPNRFFLARQALLQLIALLDGDRFALVAFEGEAYPLVPLTLDADALGLFLATVEPGIVPAPGTSLGVGLAVGLEAFVDKQRRNKVMVLVSDGEDLEGEVAEAVRRAKEAGVVVHTVGVGTEAGQPVPEVDPDGRVTGYKRDESGNAVVSRLNMATLEAIARGTGGRAFRITPQDTSLSGLASAIEGLEQKALAQEYTYRRKERFQPPLAFGLACLALGLALPLRSARPAEPRRRDAAPGREAAVAALIAMAAVLGPTSSVRAQAVPSPGPAPAGPTPRGAPAGGPVKRTGTVLDEVLLRPRRLTEEGQGEYARGNHPAALSAFERAAGTRPEDPAVRFNMADGLYKNGRYDEAEPLFRSLAGDPKSPLAAPSRFNLGNTLFQKQEYQRAIQAYREALRLTPGNEDARRNLELALRALKEREERQKREQQQREQQQQDQKDGRKDQQSKGQKQDQRGEQDQTRRGDQKQQGSDQRAGGERLAQGGQQGQQPPQTPEERADQRFRQEAGMPKERAMQLLDALEQNEKAEQKRLLALQRAQKKRGKDW
jgi:Ca-activated chloride channel family protein